MNAISGWDVNLKCRDYKSIALSYVLSLSAATGAR